MSRLSGRRSRGISRSPRDAGSGSGTSVGRPPDPGRADLVGSGVSRGVSGTSPLATGSGVQVSCLPRGLRILRDYTDRPVCCLGARCPTAPPARPGCRRSLKSLRRTACPGPDAAARQPARSSLVSGDGLESVTCHAQMARPTRPILAPGLVPTARERGSSLDAYVQRR
jgi:hypothetical protein